MTMRAPRRVPISGKFGRLTVVEFSHVSRSGAAMWSCVCECGAVIVAMGSNLRNGHTTSCGCRQREVTVTRNVASTKHGGSYSSEYRCWYAMLSRCRNPKSKDFTRWGAVGIKVLYKDFSEFLADIGPRPGADYSVDRYPNNKGHYEPGNCRWATRRQQQRNKGNNVVLTYQGTTKLLSEWAEKLNMSHGVLRQRLRKGWSHIEILSTPIGGRRQPL